VPTPLPILLDGARCSIYRSKREHPKPNPQTLTTKPKPATRADAARNYAGNAGDARYQPSQSSSEVTACVWVRVEYVNLVKYVIGLMAKGDRGDFGRSMVCVWVCVACGVECKVGVRDLILLTRLGSSMRDLVSTRIGSSQNNKKNELCSVNSMKFESRLLLNGRICEDYCTT